MSPVAKNLIRYFALAAVACSGIFAWNRLCPEKDLHLISWILVGFFTVVYAAAHFYITAGEKGTPGMFVRRFMGATTIRFLIFIVFLMAYTFTHRPQAVTFIIQFLGLYFLYTAVEVSAFYSRFSTKG